MTKTRLLIIGLLIIAVLLIIIALLTASKKQSQAPIGLPTPTPVSPFFPANQSVPTVAPVPTGDTTIIDGVTIDNFYKTSSPFDSQGDTSLANIDGQYRITYLPGTDQFLITITGPFDQNRAAAEQALLQTLNISIPDACRLNVVVQTISSANPDLAGQDFPLSFCQNLPTQSPNSSSQSEQTGQTPKPINYQTTASLDIAVGDSGGIGAVPQGSCSGSDCKTKLAALGVSTEGTLGVNGDPYGRDKLLYDALAKVLQPPSGYGTLLGLPRKIVTVDFNDGGCTGHADASGFVILNGFGSCGTAVAQFMAIHELSHVIAFRNPSLYNKFLNTIPFSRMRLFPTYNCQFDYGNGPFPGECWADMIAENVVYKYYRNIVGGRPGYATGGTFSNYPTAFSDFYNFAKTNIYKGLTF